MKKVIVLFALILFTSGCTVGPNYKRPKVDVPGAYRGARSQEGPNGVESLSPQRLQPADKPTEAPPSEPSFGDQKWWEVFQDPQLQELIRTALKQNYDARIAATRILEAQAQLGITRADQSPTVSAGASAINVRVPKEKPVNQAFETNANSVGGSFAWELDSATIRNINSLTS